MKDNNFINRVNIKVGLKLLMVTTSTFVSEIREYYSIIKDKTYTKTIICSTKVNL